MKIGVELEFFICHKSDETFYMPDIISRYLKYNSGFISMQKDSNGICIKAKNELGWVAEKNLDDMCRDTWNFAKKQLL